MVIKNYFKKACRMIIDMPSSALKRAFAYGRIRIWLR